MRNKLDGFNRVLEANKIVISLKDEKRHSDRSQFFFRKSLPLNAANLLINRRPVIWIGRHFLVVFSLKLDVSGLGGGGVIIVRGLRI